MAAVPASVLHPARRRSQCGAYSLSPLVWQLLSIPLHAAYVQTVALPAGPPHAPRHLGSCYLALRHEAGTQTFKSCMHSYNDSENQATTKALRCASPGTLAYAWAVDTCPMSTLSISHDHEWSVHTHELPSCLC